MTTTRETEPCKAPCAGCFGSGWQMEWDDDGNSTSVDCACVEMQRLPDHYRPLMVAFDGRIVHDLDDTPRRWATAVGHFPAVPDWWPSPRQRFAITPGAMWGPSTFHNHNP